MCQLLGMNCNTPTDVTFSFAGFAQRGGRSNTILILLITMPTWVNMLVRTYAWMGILQDEGIFNTILSWFGIGPVSMIHTSFAVILGMVYNFIPFMILQIHTSLAKMDKSLLEAANDLGATPVQAFLPVTLPLSLPGDALSQGWDGLRGPGAVLQDIAALYLKFGTAITTAITAIIAVWRTMLSRLFGFRNPLSFSVRAKTTKMATKPI